MHRAPGRRATITRRYTFIPVFDTVEATERFAGLAPVLGPRRHTDVAWDVTGLIPVQVADGPRNTRAAWRIYLTELFGATPDDRWHLEPTINYDLFEMLDWTFNEWACTVPGYLSPDLAMMLAPLGRPRRVIASGCRVCARPDTWVLTLPDLITTSEPLGHRVVFAPPEPTTQGAVMAAASHLSSDDYQQLAEDAYQQILDEAKGSGDSDHYEGVLTADDYLDHDPDGYVEMMDGVTAKALADVTTAHDWWRLPDEVRDEIATEVTTCTRRVVDHPGVWGCNLAALISTGLALMEGS